MRQELEKLIKEKVVLDTTSSWIYIGILESVSENCAILSEVDVHDNSETKSPKDLYILDSKDSGIKFNRKRVYVNLRFVVSFSTLEDVIKF